MKLAAMLQERFLTSAKENFQKYSYGQKEIIKWKLQPICNPVIRQSDSVHMKYLIQKTQYHLTLDHFVSQNSFAVLQVLHIEMGLN
jgi:hypothetical protein